MDKQEPSFGSLASGTTGYSDYSEDVIRSISRENESIDDFEHLSHESSPLKERASDFSQDLVSDITSDSSARDVQGLINTGLGNVVTAVYQVTDNHPSFPAQSETESVVTVDNLHQSLLKMDSNRLEMGDGFPNRKEADDKLDKFLQEMGSFAPAKHQEPPENLFKDSFDAKKAATQNFMDNERQVTQPKSTGEEFKDRHLDNKAENKLEESKTEKEVKLPESGEQLKPSQEETPKDLEGTASEKELIVISPDRSLDSTSSSNEPSNLKLQKAPQSGEKITPPVTPQRTPPHTPKEKVPEPFQQQHSNKPEHTKQPEHFKQQEDFKQPGHHHQPEHFHQPEHLHRQEHVKQPEHHHPDFHREEHVKQPEHAHPDFHRQEHIKQPEHFHEPDHYHEPKHLNQSEEHFYQPEHFHQSEEDFHQPEEYFHQPEQPFHQPENFHQAEVHKQPVSSKLPEPSIKHHEQFRHPEPANQPEVFMHPEPVRQTEPVQPVETEQIRETKAKAATIEAEALFCKMGLDAWFNPERLNPKVESLIYWRDPKKSGPVFGGVLIVLLALTYFSLISVIAYLSLLALTGTISFRIYKNIVQAVQKTGDGHPFKDILEMDISLPQSKVKETVEVAVAHINAAASELRRLFLVEDLVDSIKFGVLLWTLTYLGAWFNGMTLIIIAWVALFTLPKVYEANKTQIDANLDVVRTKIADITSKVKAAIPIGKKVEEKKEQ